MLIIVGCKTQQPELGVYARQVDGRWHYIRSAHDGCLVRKYQPDSNRYWENGSWHPITDDTIVMARRHYER